MVDECCYEGNIPWDWGNISGFELVHRFWTVCMQGGYCTHGETYLNEEEVLWWSKGGKLVGESPGADRIFKRNSGIASGTADIQRKRHHGRIV